MTPTVTCLDKILSVAADLLYLAVAQEFLSIISVIKQHQSLSENWL